MELMFEEADTTEKALRNSEKEKVSPKQEEQAGAQRSRPIGNAGTGV